MIGEMHVTRIYDTHYEISREVKPVPPDESEFIILGYFQKVDDVWYIAKLVDKERLPFEELYEKFKKLNNGMEKGIKYIENQEQIETYGRRISKTIDYIRKVLPNMKHPNANILLQDLLTWLVSKEDKGIASTCRDIDTWIEWYEKFHSKSSTAQQYHHDCIVLVLVLKAIRGGKK